MATLPDSVGAKCKLRAECDARCEAAEVNALTACNHRAALQLEVTRQKASLKITGEQCLGWTLGLPPPSPPPKYTHLPSP